MWWGSGKTRRERETEIVHHGYLGRSKSTVEHAPDVLDVHQIRQERTQIRQLGIMGVVEPTGDGYGVVGVEDIGRWGVVEDDHVLYRAA